MSNFRNKVRRRRSFIHKEASNLDGPLSRFFNEIYPGSRILKASAGSVDPALQLPTDVAGLVFWWDVGDLSTLWQDGDRTVPVASNGDPVYWIDDKSGNERGVQATAGTTTLVYGTAAFAGVEGAEFVSPDRMITATDFATEAPCTIIAALKNSQGAAQYGYFLAGGTGTRVFWEGDVFGGTGPGFYDGAHRALGVGAEKTNPEVFTMSYDGDGKVRMYEALTEISTPGGVAYSAMSTMGLDVGHLNNASIFVGVMREVAWFSSPLTQADREYVVAGMRARAGLS